jgi:hypothetical protein
MATTSAQQLRVAMAPARDRFTFELVKIVRQSKPTALTECWDCGGTLSSGEGIPVHCLLEQMAESLDPVHMVGGIHHVPAPKAVPLATLPR